MIRQWGLSLMELMVAIAVLSVLVAVGAPSFRLFLLNGEIRTAARSLQSGLSLARAEAIRLNTPVRLALMDPGWTVNDLSTGQVLHRSEARESSLRLFNEVLPTGSTGITFTSTGRPLRPDADGTSGLAYVEIRLDDNGISTDYRRLRVQLLASGSPRTCDPALPASSSMACL